MSPEVPAHSLGPGFRPGPVLGGEEEREGGGGRGRRMTGSSAPLAKTREGHRADLVHMLRGYSSYTHQQ